jgi:hypothetical protein
MTDDELLAEARSEHFELEERAGQHAWVGIVPRQRQALALLGRAAAGHLLDA